MLKSLYIKNFGLIEEIEIDFSNGFNVILGETGAGKSMLVGALSLLIGERASTSVIRKGAKKSIVEGIFEVSNNKKITEYLSEIDIDYYDELIIRREISVRGSNRVFLNDTPTTLNDIKYIGDLLVDFHGQHSHQSLLKSEKHIEFLDAFGDYDNLICNFREKTKTLQLTSKKLNDLKQREAELKEKLDIYEFQLKQIDNVSPQKNEDEEIEQELKILENSEEILNLSKRIYNLIYENENGHSAYDLLSEGKNLFYRLSDYDKNAKEYLNDLENVLSIVADIGRFIGEYSSNIDVNPDEVESKRERLGEINMLKVKYGPTLNAVLEHRERIFTELNFAKNFEEEISILREEIEKLKKEAGEIAEKLSGERKKRAMFLESEIVKVLNNLGFADVKFSVKIVQSKTKKDDSVIVKNVAYNYDKNGIDEVEFFISTNAGEDLKPLSKIASGGEISRIMLALKSMLAEKDKIPVLIFDEIDSGISGRIAQKVGIAMNKLAKTHQIIAITHLPQIAASADNHYLIKKEKINDRVKSSILKLNGEEIITEIARLISGDNITDAAIKSAEDLFS